jgi:hypothetical protein
MSKKESKDWVSSKKVKTSSWIVSYCTYRIQESHDATRLRAPWREWNLEMSGGECVIYKSEQTIQAAYSPNNKSEEWVTGDWRSAKFDE